MRLYEKARLKHDPLNPVTYVHFSFVTFVTLGYIMLGGLISFLANKLARRSD